MYRSEKGTMKMSMIIKYASHTKANKQTNQSTDALKYTHAHDKHHNITKQYTN